jgi:hypothetical protein
MILKRLLQFAIMCGALVWSGAALAGATGVVGASKIFTLTAETLN